MGRPWFHWQVRDREAADARLNSTCNGTFLIRPSYTNPVDFPFTLSVKLNDHVEHIRIMRNSKAGEQVFRVEYDKTILMFGNFDDFIRSQQPGTIQNKLNLFFPCDISIKPPPYRGY